MKHDSDHDPVPSAWHPAPVLRIAPCTPSNAWRCGPAAQ